MELESKLVTNESPPSYTHVPSVQLPASDPQQYPRAASQNLLPSAQQNAQAAGACGPGYGYIQQQTGYSPQQGYGAPQYPASRSQQQVVVVAVAGQQHQPFIVHQVTDVIMFLYAKLKHVFKFISVVRFFVKSQKIQYNIGNVTHILFGKFA